MTWAVTILYADTNTICIKLVPGNDRRDAFAACRAIYRHSNYKILSVEEVPTGTKLGANGD